MVGHKVDGPPEAVLGCSRGLCRWSWPPAGPLWVVMGRSQSVCGWSWVTPSASVDGPGPLSKPPDGSGPLSGLCRWSWAALGASVGGPGPLLGLMSAVLGRSWNLRWRSWAALEASVGGLGLSWGLCGWSWAALGATVGGLGGGSGRKVAQARAGAQA